MGTTICGAIYNRPDTIGELELARGSMLPNPVRCNLLRGHSGSHSYSDGFGGVSWGPMPTPDPDADTLSEADFVKMGERIAKEVFGGGADHGYKSVTVSHGGPGTPDFPSVIEYNRRKDAERRERIATAALQGMIAAIPAIPSVIVKLDEIAKGAVQYADALIAELDRGK